MGIAYSCLLYYFKNILPGLFFDKIWLRNSFFFISFYHFYSLSLILLEATFEIIPCIWNNNLSSIFLSFRWGTASKWKSSFFSFYFIQDPACWMVLPTLRTSLLSLFNNLWKWPHRNTQKSALLKSFLAPFNISPFEW